jgi:hypothetical protein
MFGAGSAGRIPDEDLIPWLPFLVMDKPAQDPLTRSFERHLRAENRSERTIATYLIGLRQADAFLRTRGTTLEAATVATLGRSWPTCSAGGLPAPPRPTTSRSSCCMPGWPRKKRSQPIPCGA